MKAKNSFSPLNSGNYVKVTLTVLGLCAGTTSLAIAWPALLHIGAKIV